MSESKYVVMIDDNCHPMDESYRTTLGEFDTLEEAIKASEMIVDNFLERNSTKYENAEELYKSYVLSGEDPFINGPIKSDFSAWGYAKERSYKIMGQDMPVSE